MGLIDAYLKSIKSVDVEETVDLYLHRPLAFVLARVLLPTPITPNQVTFASMVVGVTGGALVFADFPGHLPLAGLCLVLSAVIDCADGALARLRGTSSAFGRMLDGCADLATTISFVVGAMWRLHEKFEGSVLHWPLVLLAAYTVFSSSFHTVSHDHYKNVWLKFTIPTFKDNEDLDEARDRAAREAPTQGLALKIFWQVYLFYVGSQLHYIHSVDPYAPTRFKQLPPWSEEGARVYREECELPMKAWRRFFGFGSLVFGMAMAIAFDVIEYYVVLRAGLQNLPFWFWLRPLQRRRSRAVLDRLGIDALRVGPPLGVPASG
jgi:phosphatidylglycerophosphate synthase